jgi:hypothetical protein
VHESSWTGTALLTSEAPSMPGMPHPLAGALITILVHLTGSSEDARAHAAVALAGSQGRRACSLSEPPGSSSDCSLNNPMARPGEIGSAR